VGVATELNITRLERIPTWFGVGGGASRYVEPASIDELRACLELDPDLCILGDGANLLVADEGVDRLVVSLKHMAWASWSAPGDGAATVSVGAGQDLAKLINESVRRGLAGIEVLGGIPATVGGAIMMNAGGKFGAIADAVLRVHTITRDASEQTLDRNAIAFNYRTSGLQGRIITGVDLSLTPADPALLRTRLKEIMQYKKDSQPLKDSSAGCCFKNPTLTRDIDTVGKKGERVSAGMVIDRAGLKGLRIRSASVSELHANFLTADKGGRANDVITLIQSVRDRVRERFDIELETEVVIWGAEGPVGGHQ
jgi:UDP-N-acetylmuramate dehydrogenase